MSHLILPPSLYDNHKWQAALEKSAFEAPYNQQLVTFSARRSLYLSGPPIDALSLKLHGVLGNASKQKEALGSALYAIAQAALTTNRSQISGLIHGTDNTGENVAKRYKLGVLSKQSLTKELKLLESIGFIKAHKGFRGKGFNKGLAGLWFPEPPFVEWLKLHENLLKVSRLSKPSEPIRLRPSGKSEGWQDYEDSDQTIAMREQVVRTNNARAKHQWTYNPLSQDGTTYVEDATFRLREHDLTCSRVFNGDFESGGRFYCPAQSLRKAERRTLMIDDQPTIEIDYRSLHPRMLYNMNNLTAPNDCYDPLKVKTPEERSEAKRACMVVLNAFNQASAIKALTSSGMPIACAKRAVEAFENDHNAIAHEFYSSAWKRLHRQDSELVAMVLNACLTEDMPALPVHDSFVTRTEHAFKLKEIIEDSYKSLMGYKAEISFGDDPEDLDWLWKDLGMLEIAQ